MQSLEQFWAALEAQSDARWTAVAEKMRSAGYEPEQGAVLLMPTSYWGATEGPYWVVPTIEHEVPMMMRMQPVPYEHLRSRYANEAGSLLDLDVLLGEVVMAVLKHAEAGGSDDEAGIRQVKAVQAHVRRMITAEKGAAAKTVTLHPVSEDALLEVARRTGLRQQMHGVSPTVARATLAAFFSRVLTLAITQPEAAAPPQELTPRPRQPDDKVWPSDFDGKTVRLDEARPS